jgi:glucokinase
LRREFGHVSAERVVLGSGLENIYRAVIAIDGMEAPKRNAAEIQLPHRDTGFSHLPRISERDQQQG